MSSSTTQKQPAVTIIEEDLVSLGKRKRQTTSKDDKEVLQQKLSNIISDKIKKYNEEIVVFLETKKTCLQGSLEMVNNLAKTNHNIHRTAIQISKALASLDGTKQLWKQVKKDHSMRLYKEHKDKILSQQQQQQQQQPENDENEATSIGSDEDTLRMTSPVAIVRVLRDDISNDLVHNSLKQAAMDATTTVSNGTTSGFNITKILPKPFTIRNKEPLNNINKIMVAHPNLSLKGQLDKLYKPNTKAKDLQEICTHGHLQFIQPHHLGNKKYNNKNDTIHPLWADLIFKNSNFPSTADGFKHHNSKEFNTNLQNMLVWN
ncbi:hypothetical protein BDC45DRAFT_532288 [Circinella umbellata]|nr:hypothetical protein BDC45DRAFT_532288 [Circinella umbellata]